MFCFWGVWHCVLVWGVIFYCNVGQCLNCIDLLCGLLSAKVKEFGVNTFSVVLILLFDGCEIWRGELHFWEEYMKPSHEEDGDKC